MKLPSADGYREYDLKLVYLDGQLLIRIMDGAYWVADVRVGNLGVKSERLRMGGELMRYVDVSGINVDDLLFKEYDAEDPDR